MLSTTPELSRAFVRHTDMLVDLRPAVEELPGCCRLQAMLFGDQFYTEAPKGQSVWQNAYTHLRQSGAQPFECQHGQEEVVIAGKGVKVAAKPPSNDCRAVCASWHCPICCGVGLQAVDCSVAAGQVVGHLQ